MNHAAVEVTVTVDHLLVAAGTTDLPLIAPGATLPGVMTSRAIRILLDRHRVIPASGSSRSAVGPGWIDCAPISSRPAATLSRNLPSEVVEIERRKQCAGSGSGRWPFDRCRRRRVSLPGGPDPQLAGWVEAPRVFDLISARSATRLRGGPGRASNSSVARRPGPPHRRRSCRVRRRGGPDHPGGGGLQDVGLGISEAILRWEAVQREQWRDVPVPMRSALRPSRSMPQSARQPDHQRRQGGGPGPAWICQGIYCLSAMAERLQAAGIEAGEIEPMTSRPPTRLIPVGVAASHESDQDA